MKNLYTYIIEALSERAEFIKNAEKLNAWWVAHIDNYYDHSHGANKDNLRKCDLIDGKEIKCDCAGFVGAVLYMSGYTGDPLAFSVKYGSFNLDKHINNEKPSDEIPEYIDIEYMKDLPGEWHVYKLNNIDEWPECIPGDILYSSGHVAILGNDGELLQCSELGEDDRHFRAYWRLGKMHN